MHRPTAIAVTFALTACATATIPPGEPVVREAFCESFAEIVCTSDASCFPDSSPADCMEVQVGECDRVIQPLLDDPRLGYEPTRAGTFLASLENRASSCGSAPIDFDAFLDVFTGTGPTGADCTPARMDATNLLTSSLSCASGGACRLYLRADGSPEGVCEPRTDASCSHALDCGAGQFCSLPDRWQAGVWGECRPLRADGWSCASDLECASRHCAGTCMATPEIERPLAVSYEELVLAESPLAYLRFERTTARFSDRSGHGHGGQVVGAITHESEGAIADDATGAITLGDGTYVVIAEIDELTAAEAFSLEVWFRRSEVESNRPLLELWDGERAGVHVWNHPRGDQLYANLTGETGEGHTITSAEGAVHADTWHHAVLTHDGTTGRLYLDGMRVGTVAVAAPLALAGDLHIGHRAAIGDAMERFFQGSIDEVAVYDHALTESAIRAHHAAAETGVVEHELPLYGWLAP